LIDIPVGRCSASIKSEGFAAILSNGACLSLSRQANSENNIPFERR
jgi:hypothetical protein